MPASRTTGHAGAPLRSGAKTSRRSGTLSVLASGCGTSIAHADALTTLHGSIWGHWDVSPLIILGCVLVTTVYVRGFRNRRRRGDTVSGTRCASYLAAVAVTYLVLQSPFDTLSDHLFWVHRVQHVLLHHLIPMLLALSAPIPELVNGLPHWARRHVLRPLIGSGITRRVWGVVQHPVVAPLLFVALIYFWLVPPIFDAATVNPTLHEIMHFSMLIEGIPFWWLMLDPKPGRVRYGYRMIILCAIMFPQIAAGAYIALTSTPLYPIYARLDQGWVASYLMDQHIGGMIIWIPTCMMSVFSALIVLHFWMRRERIVAPAKHPTNPVGAGDLFCGSRIR